MVPPLPVAADVEYWKQRLIHRKYPEPANSPGRREFSIRIEWQGTSYYFPLGISDEIKAADRARQIYDAVVNEGWASVNAKFPRELTLALRWLDNPVAWTYTTIHTQLNGAFEQRGNGRSSDASPARVALVEPDAGIRHALISGVNRQPGFRCDAAFTGVSEALCKIPRLKLDFVLANRSLSNESGSACLEEMQRLKPGFPGLLYSVFEDSDQLFKATPGGAVGYLLKRTLPGRILEPIAEPAGHFSREQIGSRVHKYFKRLSASLPLGPPSAEMAKLTPREHEILANLSKGALAKEIARSLGISIWTVHDHMKGIFEKLNVHTRTEAVVKYLQK